MSFIKNIKQLVDESVNRIDWHQYFMSIALLASVRSSCKRLKVGCVLTKDNRIISTGYNGFIKGFKHKSIVRNNHEQATVHAEQNAITDAALRGVNVNGCNAYITHYPCIHCFKLLCSINVKNIYYYDNYKNDPLVLELLDKNPIKIIKIDTMIKQEIE